MKFVISFLLTSSALANPIHLYHEGNVAEATMLKEIMKLDYQIPEDIISVKKISKSCESIKGAGKLDLCLKNNGDLFVVSVDREFINESLKVFQAP